MPLWIKGQSSDTIQTFVLTQNHARHQDFVQRVRLCTFLGHLFGGMGVNGLPGEGVSRGKTLDFGDLRDYENMV